MEFKGKVIVVENKYDIHTKCVVRLSQVDLVKEKMNSLGLFYMYKEDPNEEIDKVFGVVIGNGGYWFVTTRQAKYDSLTVGEINYNELMKMQIK